MAGFVWHFGLPPVVAFIVFREGDFAVLLEQIAEF
jgi:hypothetical protein